MDIEDLNKTQIILLVLLVSFITSIATGIVTVTLLDQAPPGVTQTINRVVEKTVQVITPTETREREIVRETVVIKEEDLIVQAVKKNSTNVVRIGLEKSQGFRLIGIGDESIPDIFKPLGTAFVITSSGILVADSSTLKGNKNYIVKTKAGDLFETEILSRNEEISLVLLQLRAVAGQEQTGDSSEDNIAPDGSDEPKISIPPSLPPFSNITFAGGSSVDIGQTAIAIGLDDTISILLGIVSSIDTIILPSPEDESVKNREIISIYTSIDTSSSYFGGPLIDTDGDVVGINVSNTNKNRAIPSSRVLKMLSEYREQVRKDAETSGPSGVLLDNSHI